MKRAGRNGTGGFSLIEVVVAITILGLVTAPICGSLVLSHRLNARSEELMQARLAVTNTVETLMAEGIDPNKIDPSPAVPSQNYGTAGDYGEVNIKVTVGSNPSYYSVTVTSDTVDSVTVETQIRADSGGGGDG